MKVNKLGECCCPNCGGIMQFIEWNFVDSELNLEETYKLTNGSFFKHTCPECGKEFSNYHSLNFNDPRSKTLVRYVMNDDLDTKNKEGISHMFLGDEKAPDYTIDVLFYPISFMRYIRRVRFDYLSKEKSVASAS